MRRRGGVSKPPPDFSSGGGGVVGWRPCRENNDLIAGPRGGEREWGVRSERDVAEEREEEEEGDLKIFEPLRGVGDGDWGWDFLFLGNTVGTGSDLGCGVCVPAGGVA